MPELKEIQRETGPEVVQLPAIQFDGNLEWDGPHDPDNPRNASLANRLYSTAVITMLAFASAFAGSVNAPALDELMTTFNCSYEVAVLPLAMCMLGMSFGPLVGAPLSEELGRRAVFLYTTPIFALFMTGGGFARSMTAFVICRFFSGVFAAPNINNASATILDYTPDRHRGIYLGCYYSVPSFAATFAPMTGGFIVRSAGWRWTQWTSVIVTLVFYIPVLFTKETYKRQILRRRAQKRGIDIVSSQDSSFTKKLRHFATVLIQRPLHMLFTEPIVLLVSLYNGMIYGLIYAFVTSIPWVFETYFDFSGTSQSLSFLGATLGTIFASLPLGIIDYFYYQRRLISDQSKYGINARLTPEHRLPPAMIGSVLLPVSLLIAGWTADGRTHWALPILFDGLAMASSLMVYSAASLFMLDAYGPLYGASASSAMMFSRYFMSFLFPLFTLQMFKGLGVGWATTLLAVCTAVLAPIPWCFWKYGEYLRKRSKYETSL